MWRLLGIVEHTLMRLCGIALLWSLCHVQLYATRISPNDCNPKHEGFPETGGPNVIPVVETSIHRAGLDPEPLNPQPQTLS